MAKNEHRDRDKTIKNDQIFSKCAYSRRFLLNSKLYKIVIGNMKQWIFQMIEMHSYSYVNIIGNSPDFTIFYCANILISNS